MSLGVGVITDFCYRVLCSTIHSFAHTSLRHSLALNLPLLVWSNHGPFQFRQLCIFSDTQRHLMNICPTQVVNRLEHQIQNLSARLQSSQLVYGDYVDHTEEVCDDDDSPVLTSFVEELGKTVVKSMTNFTMSKLKALWEMMRAEDLFAWTQGRGHKRQTTGKDTFFMAFSVLKYCNPWYKHTGDFRIQVSAFERMVKKR